LLYGDSGLNALSEEIIRCAIEVHRELGPGLLESVYETALCIELKTAAIEFKRQVGIPLYYRAS
jgi:GxxExxY protein